MKKIKTIKTIAVPFTQHEYELLQAASRESFVRIGLLAKAYLKAAIKKAEAGEKGDDGLMEGMPRSAEGSFYIRMYLCEEERLAVKAIAEERNIPMTQVCHMLIVSILRIRSCE